MSTFTNVQKSGIPTNWDIGNWDVGLWDSGVITNISKSTTTWVSPLKAGSGWLYDQANLKYDGPLDSNSGLPLYYNGEGTAPVVTNIQKS